MQDVCQAAWSLPFPDHYGKKYFPPLLLLTFSVESCIIPASYNWTGKNARNFYLLFTVILNLIQNLLLFRRLRVKSAMTREKYGTPRCASPTMLLLRMFSYCQALYSPEYHKSRGCRHRRYGQQRITENHIPYKHCYCGTILSSPMAIIVICCTPGRHFLQTSALRAPPFKRRR